MEGDLFRFDLHIAAVIDLVAAQYHWYARAGVYQIAVPCRHALICHARGQIEHNDSGVCVEIIAVTHA